MSKELRRTRFYTVNYRTYHRDRTCSYLDSYNKDKTVEEFKKAYSFLAWEPYDPGNTVEITLKSRPEGFNILTLKACNRCGK